jgi:hypothetical protein
MNIKITQGDTFTLPLAFTNEDTGAAINITGYSIYMTLKKSLEDTDAQAALKKTVTSHTNAAGGLTQIVLSAAETLALPLGDLYFDVKYKDGSSNVRTVLPVGTATVLQTVTMTAS